MWAFPNCKVESQLAKRHFLALVLISIYEYFTHSGTNKCTPEYLLNDFYHRNFKYMCWHCNQRRCFPYTSGLIRHWSPANYLKTFFKSKDKSLYITQTFRQYYNHYIGIRDCHQRVIRCLIYAWVGVGLRRLHVPYASTFFSLHVFSISRK